MLRSPEKCDLRDVVASAVSVREVDGSGWPSRFFEVQLSGVVRYRDDGLLSHEAVANYLAQVAPVDFHPAFSFAREISQGLENEFVSPEVIQVEIENYGTVFRPHRDLLPCGKTEFVKFREVEWVRTPGREDRPAAVTWILHADYRGSLPASTLVDGWRFRVGNMQIGNNDLLLPQFTESRFNSWCVAETHITDSRILPNGRRDNFEQTSHFLDLINHLAPHARDLSRRCRISSKRRNHLRKLDLGLARTEQQVTALRRSSMAASVASTMTRTLRAELGRLERLADRSLADGVQQDRYKKQIAQMKRRLDREKTIKDSETLRAFPPAHRALLTDVFSVIYRSYPDVADAQKLVDSIMRRVSRNKGQR